MRYLLLLLAAGATGCQGAGFTVPKTAAPVLLGPVDRVGGHRAGSLPEDARTVKTETGTFFHVLTCGLYISASRVDTGVVPVTTRMLDATSARDDADVRVSSVSAKSDGVVLCGVLYSESVTVRGRVAEVKR